MACAMPSRPPPLLLLLLLALTGGCGVFGRAAPARNVDVVTGQKDAAPMRWIRAAAAAAAAPETHRERCAELEAPWLENPQPARDNGTRVHLRVRPLAPGTPPVTRAATGVFPGKPLLSFVRRVYRCCQEGFQCRRARGVQGRRRGATDVEFVLSREVLWPTLTRAELHLQLSNPHGLELHPVLSASAKHNRPTRFRSWSRGKWVELQVDLLSPLQRLQVAPLQRGSSLVNIRAPAASSVGGPGAPGAPQDVELGLGLVVGCSRDGASTSCERGGVHLLHSPFMALSFR